MAKDYSQISLEELEAERQRLSNAKDEAVAKFKAQIHDITAVIDMKLAEKKVAGMTEAEREAVGVVLNKRR